MRRKQNVIIFSAGESVRNGNVEYIENQLSKRGINCFDWRSLFKYSHDAEHIALLPCLLKKIPTFDFALIVAESVDSVKMRGELEQGSMRDNVIFELGLCVMGLGEERVILLAEEGIRIPEDLDGVGKIGVEYITFKKVKSQETIGLIERTINQKNEVNAQKEILEIDEILQYINRNSDLISPVFVGAAVSSAEAYFLNFIVRLLENTDKGFSSKNNAEARVDFPKDFELRIIIPTSIDCFTRSKIIDFYKANHIDEFVINEAGIRGLYFNGIYDSENDKISIIDIPTSITASYTVVNSILDLESDEDYDALAEERFTMKELDVYVLVLQKLLTPEVARERLSFIRNTDKKEWILKKLHYIIYLQNGGREFRNVCL